MLQITGPNTGGSSALPVEYIVVLVVVAMVLIIGLFAWLIWEDMRYT